MHDGKVCQIIWTKLALVNFKVDGTWVLWLLSDFCSPREVHKQRTIATGCWFVMVFMPPEASRASSLGYRPETRAAPTTFRSSPLMFNSGGTGTNLVRTPREKRPLKSRLRLILCSHWKSSLGTHWLIACLWAGVASTKDVSMRYLYAPMSVGTSYQY